MNPLHTGIAAPLAPVALSPLASLTTSLNHGMLAASIQACTGCRWNKRWPAASPIRLTAVATAKNLRAMQGTVLQQWKMIIWTPIQMLLTFQKCSNFSSLQITCVWCRTKHHETLYHLHTSFHMFGIMRSGSIAQLANKVAGNASAVMSKWWRNRSRRITICISYL